jgi:molybdate transport system substrate-binding protein
VRARLTSSVILTTILLATSCGSDGDTDSLRVAAASSLTNSFVAIESAFEELHPDIDLQFNFGASSELAAQIIEGAPVDVFASADTTNMEKVADEGLITNEISTFATNSLRIIVARGNPRGISGLDDLAQKDLIVVTCDPNVPIGRYSAEVLAAAGVVVEPASYEENVKGIVAKVTSGEADAGIVYVTDVMAAGDQASGVDIPTDVNITATYPVAALADSSAKESAQLFVAFLLSDDGQAILSKFGFGGIGS